MNYCYSILVQGMEPGLFQSLRVARARLMLSCGKEIEGVVKGVVEGAAGVTFEVHEGASAK